VRGRRKTPVRLARPNEIMLLERLAAAGPLLVVEGPIGCCLKRGWCVQVPCDITADASPEGTARRGRAAIRPPRYAISAAGLLQLRRASELQAARRYLQSVIREASTGANR
jgi:hypothetical protein